MSGKQIHFFQEDVHYQLKNKDKLRQWLDNVMTTESESYHDINIILCSDEFLYQLNLTYLSHDHYTDVLTFDFSESENIVSGDIYISIPRIKDNAREYKVTLKDEIHRVIVHGILHLLGYSDKRAKDRMRMTEKENLYLSLRPEGL